MKKKIRKYLVECKLIMKKVSHDESYLVYLQMVNEFVFV